MTDLNNITIKTLDDGMVSLWIDAQPISEKYETKFDASIVDDIKALENGQKLKLFEQFIFSHTDLNFEHAYYYVTGIEKLDDGYRLAKNFVYRIKIENQPDIEHVITNQGKAMTADDVRQFIHAHIQKSLTDYTDLNYAY
ncbi:hypothetical protein A3K93_12935 [Acinetobacter sp. NCu2D-2]|uniref:hypothetical protein n=1 Tax=Acinetobacter sp. NCu2D-2 TaxID=1608473 RepID=UPI0007CDCC8E|nr:hypothetical protein [Acinetobacter sp. NCu2D-2]ANF83002.1 hypothetical protein A3K93_12935 [Acinetobacter sp. NCu2D-2]